jgi:hypothetical protein
MSPHAQGRNCMVGCGPWTCGSASSPTRLGLQSSSRSCLSFLFSSSRFPILPYKLLFFCNSQCPSTPFLKFVPHCPWSCSLTHWCSLQVHPSGVLTTLYGKNPQLEVAEKADLCPQAKHTNCSFCGLFFLVVIFVTWMSDSKSLLWSSFFFLLLLLTATVLHGVHKLSVQLWQFIKTTNIKITVWGLL